MLKWGRRMVKISIIMPLYNAAKYLEESLQSIQKQTFTDYELICINDASTDNTMEILQNYQKKDKRIRILSNGKRCGAAVSRNKGLKEAKGSYLTFLDGDDIFEEEMLACMFQTAEEKHTDVLLAKLKHVFGEDIYRKQKIPNSEAFYERYSSEVFEIKEYLPCDFGNWELAVEGKLYKKDFILSNCLEFQDLSCANDVYFVCMSMLLAKRLLYLKDDRVMIYQREHHEPTRISYDRDPKCTYLAFLHIMEELKNRNKFQEVYGHYYYRLYFALRNAILICKTEEKAEDFYQFLQKEGIETIRALGGKYFDKLDNYIKDILEQFQKLDFSSKWYKEETGLRMYLCQQHYAQAVINLFLKYQREGKKIGIWGAGANGSSLLQFCKGNDLGVDMIIDKSKEKQGYEIGGYLIKAPEDIEDDIQVIIVSSRNIIASVRLELSGRNMEIIDINQLLYVY